MRYRVKSEFVKWLLLSVLCGIMIWSVIHAVQVEVSHSSSTKKASVKEPEVKIVKNVEYYGAILNDIINDSKCTCGDKKFDENKFQKLAKQKISSDFIVTLQRVLINDSTGNYYKWEATVSKDSNEVFVTWR